MSLRAVPNELVNREELARRMGCSVKTVDRMRSEGMPYVVWGRRMLRFDPQAAMSWFLDQRRDAA
jgi:phage terminase Nu1 subunit (DNA packaging protein)